MIYFVLLVSKATPRHFRLVVQEEGVHYMHLGNEEMIGTYTDSEEALAVLQAHLLLEDT